MAPLATVGAAVLLLLPLVASAAGERGIVATGGGVAPINTSMVLKYHGGVDGISTSIKISSLGYYSRTYLQCVKQSNC